MGDSEGGAALGGVETPKRQSMERLAKSEDLADLNLNYEIREMPQFNPDLEGDFSVNSALRARAAAGVPSAPAELPKPIPELYISDPVARQPSGTELPMRAAAGISSNARHYKMASDIFGTGMDRSWNDEEPLKSAQVSVPTKDRNGNGMERPKDEPDFKVPELPLARNRNEPGSFKITETASEIPSEPNVDFAYGSSAARKARESSGNPLTGQGYGDDMGAKTAKRYYTGSNANSKLW